MHTLEELRDSGMIIFEAISGSKAYGLDTPESDTDIRGVFVAPRKLFYADQAPAQINDETNDTVYYEIGRFIELLSKANPTALELLFTPEDCVRIKHPVFDQVDRGAYLTRQCRDTFAGYAHAQIKKARGLNKKIANPMSEERKGVLDFCYMAEGQGSTPVREWLTANGYENKCCGLVKVPHMSNIHAVFYDETGSRGFHGLTRDDAAESVLLSSIPKGTKPVTYMSFNKDGFSKYCRQYAEYWAWVEKRNDARFAQTLEHGRNYDAKNMMHTFRLLDMAAEISREGTIHVRRRNREELLAIRKGEAEYEALLERAEAKLAEIDALYAASDLVECCDPAAAREHLVSIRSAWYNDHIEHGNQVD